MYVTAPSPPPSRGHIRISIRSGAGPEKCTGTGVPKRTFRFSASAIPVETSWAWEVRYAQRSAMLGSIACSWFSGSGVFSASARRGRSGGGVDARVARLVDSEEGWSGAKKGDSGEEVREVLIYSKIFVTGNVGISFSLSSSMFESEANLSISERSQCENAVKRSKVSMVVVRMRVPARLSVLTVSSRVLIWETEKPREGEGEW
jgi:hypothetical protein